ncbi:hypothetical protein QDR98_14920 [Acinetobacter baumannii]|uniref:hypothetical protein n=1 Tax=Acinetobacter baumannii TaxID=470 RepID=UPI00244A955E|nr:hypothetical protein [Acinetobacter baumannii]MDH2667223.1 hypothetical protein [Acinetobacter baumannii]
MATNWNAVLANINNASDILAILRKVLGLLDGKVDLTRIDEIISDIENMQTNVETALNNVTSALSEFDTHSQEAIEQVIAAGLMEGFNTEAELLATRPTVAKKYAKAEDTDIIWFWNKPAGAPDGSYWTSTGQSELSRAKAYTDNLRDRVFFNAINTDFNISGFINSTGQLAHSTFFKSTDYLKVIENTPYRILSQVTGAANYAWFTKDKVFISAFGTDQTTLVEKTYTSPPNAAFVRLCAYNTAAQAVAYMRADVYKIDQIKKILEQHTPATSSKLSLYGSSNVSDTLDAVISKQNIIITNQNNILSQLDLMSDKESPFFVNTSEFVKAVSTPTNFGVVNVTARVSDTQMTVSDATAFIYSGSCVVYDPTANSYTSHNVIGISGTTITVMPPLPANPTQAQTMHEANQGQHLTLFGYKGLADFVVNSIQKYSYKKSENRIFNFNPTKFERQTNAQGQITTDGTTIAIPVTYVGTAKTGGFVSGTTNLVKICDMNSGNMNIGNNAHTQYLTRSYQLQDGTAGNGFEISFDAQKSDGFIEIPLAVRDELYTSSIDSQQYRTSGKARLQVFNGSTSIHDAVYAVGQVHHVFVDFAAAETIRVRVTCETSTPTSVLLSGIFAYKKSTKTSKESFFEDGDVVAFLGDSWTQYPIATSIGETGQTRPDGSVSTGSQWLSRRMKEKLQAQGKNVTMLNMGFGGQTSRWGKYWVNTIINLDPKPTHCVLCFYINDANSVGAPSNNFYDFDPVNMFTNKPESEGGVNGKIPSFDEWEANIKWLCDKLAANGIKPIVIMPSQTGSATQAQGIRSGELDRIADGFS